MNDNKFARGFVSWLPLAVAVTGVSGLVYLAVQQDLRQGANDPQIQMAEDAAVSLAKGDMPSAVVPRGTSIDIAQSLSPWIAVYDPSGKPLESSGVLDGALPQPPITLFDAGREETRITWQPRAGVRQALILVQAKNGDFIASGRSLKAVEEREDSLTLEVFLAWAVTMTGSLIFSFITALL
jgi:hypothetical protein